MEVKTTPWYATRSLISPQVEMLSPDGMIQFKSSFLKDESPKTVKPQKRYVHYDTNYIKYCFLKEFYQLLFDSVRQSEDNEIVLFFLNEVVNDAVGGFAEYCREQTLEEDAKELFRSFCKIHLFH